MHSDQKVGKAVREAYQKTDDGLRRAQMRVEQEGAEAAFNSLLSRHLVWLYLRVRTCDRNLATA